MLRILLVLGILGALAGGCSESQNVTGCENDDQCGTHMVCDEGRCIPDLPECVSGVLCGNVCCSEGEECVAGRCAEPCTGDSSRCGGDCCEIDEVCLVEGCCADDRVCGETCCALAESCRDGRCSDCPRELCDDECCDSGEVCLEGGCCDLDRVCGDEGCCGRGEECVDGSCVDACEGVRCAGECCAPGESCLEGLCQPPCETDLCGGVCCARGEVCADGACCPSVRSCGESCCSEGTWCNGADECIACDRPLCSSDCCPLDEICFAGACCTEERVCAEECCALGSVCEGETCHLDCGEGTRCASDDGAERCCTGDEVCFMGDCLEPSVECTFDGECGLEEYCDEIIEACLPIPESDCEYFPPVGEFSPVVEWHWEPSGSYRQIMMTPAVANLTDDNGDGVIDPDDVPDIVVITFAGSNYHTDGQLFVLSGDDGRIHYTLDTPRFRPGGSIAIGDVDDDEVPDIVACGSSGGIVVLNNDGSVKWTIPSGCAHTYTHPSIADLDGDGTVEIITEYRVFSDGAEVCRGFDDLAMITTAADLDGDGMLEVVGGNRAFSFDASSDTPCLPLWTNTDVYDGYPAVADMDLDGDPDIVVVRSNIWILEGATGAVNWGPYPIPGGGAGGAPTVADFDGDGRPETSTAGLDYYAVYDLDCVAGGDPVFCSSGRVDGMLWTQLTHDHSSSQTGSSVFDFEGDGAAEVVYADEFYLRIYRGVDGHILYSLPNSSGTLFEYPLVVDVDNDAQAEIVVISNDYAFHTVRGVRVIGDSLENWVRTRRIWNQHTYHVTNINEDATAPAPELPNWLDEGLNNFRQNVQTYGVHNAPNIVPEDFFVDDRHCPVSYRLGVHVMNRGSRSVPAGLIVGFYEGDPAGEHLLIGSTTIDHPLLSGGGQFVSLVWETPEELRDPGRIFEFYVVVDDTSLGDEVAVHECHEDDNIAGPLSVSCEIL